jgi:hypothetical protein
LHIPVQWDEKFPALRQSMNLADMERLHVWGLCCGICPASSQNAYQAISIKAEVPSDAEAKEDPLAVTSPEIKAEPENLTDLQKARSLCSGRSLTSAQDAYQAISVKAEGTFRWRSSGGSSGSNIYRNKGWISEFAVLAVAVSCGTAICRRERTSLQYSSGTGCCVASEQQTKQINCGCRPSHQGHQLWVSSFHHHKLCQRVKR